MYLTLFRLNIFSDTIVKPIQASLLTVFLSTAPPNDKVAIPLANQHGGLPFVCNHSLLRAQLEATPKTNLLSVCFDEKTRDPISLQRASEPLIRFRLALHMFPLKAKKSILPDGNQKEIALHAEVEAALATAVTAFYTANIAALS